MTTEVSTENSTEAENEAWMALLQSVNFDTAAAQVAVNFIQDNSFKQALFIKQFNRVTSESDFVARATKAVQNSIEALGVRYAKEE